MISQTNKTRMCSSNQTYFSGFIVNVYPSTLVCNLSEEIEITCNVSKNNLNASHVWIHSFGGVEIRSLYGKVHDGMSTLQIPFCDYRDTGTYTCKWTFSMETHYSSSHIYVKSQYLFNMMFSNVIVFKQLLIHL